MKGVGRRRKLRRKIGQEGFDLQLTSMMDVLVIIVVFLLKTYSASNHAFQTLPGLEMPISQSQEIPPDSLQVIVTTQGVTFEGAQVATLSESLEFLGADLDEDGLRVRPLFDALSNARHKLEILAARTTPARDQSGAPLPYRGPLALLADKRVPYDVIRKIMYTGSVAGFTTFRLLTQRVE